MYFIVYILQAAQYVVVPYSWIKLNPYLERIVNHGINSNIIFEIFYTHDPDAFENDVPRMDYAPNMEATLANRFPNEGWYRGYIRRFKCTYSSIVVCSV